MSFRVKNHKPPLLVVYYEEGRLSLMPYQKAEEYFILRHPLQVQ